jgi:hypothetical protein
MRDGMHCNDPAGTDMVGRRLPLASLLLLLLLKKETKKSCAGRL